MHTYLSEYIKVSSCSKNLGHKKHVKVSEVGKKSPKPRIYPSTSNNVRFLEDH